MKVKIIIPIYNDWQSVFKLFDEINNLKIDKNFEISMGYKNDPKTIMDEILEDCQEFMNENA